MTEEQTGFKQQTPDKDIAVIDRRHTALEPVQEQSADLVVMAMQKGYSPELIEKMMDLAERNEKNIARKAYVKAMADFKASPPKIYKTKGAGFDHKNGQGRTEYSFAPLPVICEVIDPALSKHGLSYSWKHEQDEKNIIVTCIMTHELGHSEQSTLRGPRDDSGKKNFIQSIGSTISYLERYTLLGVAGLATHDMDQDDGQAAGGQEYITEDQAIEINDLIKETSSNLKVFLKVAKADSVEHITADKYPMLIKQLNIKKDKMRQPGE